MTRPHIRLVPRNEERSAYYARAGTSVPAQLRRAPLADRLFVAFLKALAWVGKKWRKR